MKRQMEDDNDDDVDPTASSLSASPQIPAIEVEPYCAAKSNSKIQVLTVSNAFSNILNINNICKESLINLNLIGVCEHTQLCKELGLHMVQKSKGFNNVRQFCDGVHISIRIFKGNGHSFFRAISYLLPGGEVLHTHIRIKVTQFKSNGAHIQNVQAYLKQFKMGHNSIWVTENEIMAAARLMHRHTVVYSMYEIKYRSLKKRLHYPASRHIDQLLNQHIYLDILQGNHIFTIISI